MSSQSVEARTAPDGPPRPETPPVPDESFWNDAGERAERADWMDALGEPAAETTNEASGSWVEPVTDDEPTADPVATSDPDVWAAPLEPVAPVVEIAPRPAPEDEIVFTPVPVADVVPIRPDADAVEAEDNLSWLDAGGLDDLLPPA